MEAQRQELMAGFDDAQRKREHEFRKKADDLSNSLLASELKVRIFALQGSKFIGYINCSRLDVPLDMVFT